MTTSSYERAILGLLEGGPLTASEIQRDVTIARGYLWNVLEGLRTAGLISVIDTRSIPRGRPVKVYALIEPSGFQRMGR